MDWPIHAVIKMNDCSATLVFMNARSKAWRIGDDPTIIAVGKGTFKTSNAYKRPPIYTVFTSILGYKSLSGLQGRGIIERYSSHSMLLAGDKSDQDDGSAIPWDVRCYHAQRYCYWAEHRMAGVGKAVWARAPDSLAMVF